MTSAEVEVLRERPSGCGGWSERRVGVGSALLDDLTRRLGERGIIDLYLLTERKSAAEAFFGRYGFELETDAIKLWHTL